MRTLTRSPPWLLALALMTLAGCGTSLPSLTSLFGGRGTRLIQSADRVWREYDCGARRLPFAEVNEVDVTPSSIAPGGSFTQHLVYSACLPQGWKELPVRVRTRIYHEGREILSDVQPAFQLQPGRWAVDATVSTPPTAQSGSYTVRIDMAGAVSTSGVAGFAVRR